jgi:alpha-1,3-mannosyl-glycoprotein beta-1,2-N-acetylglucosaminyltransferase
MRRSFTKDVKGSVRRRLTESLDSKPAERQGDRSCKSSNLTSQVAGATLLPWRAAVLWTARLLLPVILLLSSANLVRIGEGDHAHSGTREFAGPLLLVIAHKRAAYLERCLDSVLKYHPGGNRWMIAVSLDRQDGEQHEDVARVVARTKHGAPRGVTVISWIHGAQLDEVGEGDENGLSDVQSYRRISRHYRWALTRAFAQRLGDDAIERVVVLEDDMEIAPDFYNYFDGLSHLLDSDRSLFCISAWNDNGKQPIVSDPGQLHRTDFFPGLGWMISRRFWDEIEDRWPKLYWDDWLRSSNQTHGRQCIRPEVSRTANFGALGASQSFNFKKHVSKVFLNTEFTDFAALDLSYLKPPAYDELIFGRMSRAVLLKYSNYLTSRPQNSDVIARYPAGNIDAIGKRTGIMTDHRKGVFRTSYRGVVVIPWNGHWAFLVEKGWSPPKGYALGITECCSN